MLDIVVSMIYNKIIDSKRGDRKMTSLKSVKWTLGDGRKAEAKIEVKREVNDDISYADGWNINLGKKTYEAIMIKVMVDGKQIANSYNAPSITNNDKITKMGGYAIINSTNMVVLKKEVYENIMAAIAEAMTEANQDEEYKAVKAVEIEKAAREEAVREATEKEQQDLIDNHGMCPKCGTWCYGECSR